MSDRHFLIFTIVKFFTKQTIMFNVIDSLKINHRKDGFEQKDEGCLRAIEVKDECYKRNG